MTIAKLCFFLYRAHSLNVRTGSAEGYTILLNLLFSAKPVVNQSSLLPVIDVIIVGS
jgi:hypothetical protein